MVECTCGHGIGEHNEYGCFARTRTGSERCGCLRSTVEVIDGAVDDVRRQYQQRWHDGDAS
jgi:hypothetical protein